MTKYYFDQLCDEMEDALGVYQNSPEWVEIKEEGARLIDTIKRLQIMVTDRGVKLTKVEQWLKHHRRIPTDSEDWDLILEVLS